jgi:hypothetical protein
VLPGKCGQRDCLFYQHRSPGTMLTMLLNSNLAQSKQPDLTFQVTGASRLFASHEATRSAR